MDQEQNPAPLEDKPSKSFKIIINIISVLSIIGIICLYLVALVANGYSHLSTTYRFFLNTIYTLILILVIISSAKLSDLKKSALIVYLIILNLFIIFCLIGLILAAINYGFPPAAILYLSLFLITDIYLIGNRQKFDQGGFLNQQKVPNQTITQAQAGLVENKKTKTSNKILFYLAVVILLYALFLLIIWLGTVSFSAKKSAISTGSDLTIKNSISGLRSSAEQYFDKYGTYAGFTGDQTINANIQEQGSQLVVQGTSATTFVAYARLLKTGTLFCADATGFVSEINSIKPTQTTCK